MKLLTPVCPPASLLCRGHTERELTGRWPHTAAQMEEDPHFLSACSSIHLPLAFPQSQFLGAQLKALQLRSSLAQSTCNISRQQGLWQGEAPDYGAATNNGRFPFSVFMQTLRSRMKLEISSALIQHTVFHPNRSYGTDSPLFNNCLITYTLRQQRQMSDP